MPVLEGNAMRKSNPVARQILLSCVAVPALAGVAKAALYGNFVGPNISYIGVTEQDSQITGPPTVTSNPTALFGAPVLSPPGSDDLTFPDLSFSAQAADGSFTFQDGKLTMDIVPSTSTSTIHSLDFDEGGAYHLTSSGTGQNASVEATLLFNDLRITALNGSPLAIPIIVAPTFTESATPQSGTIAYNSQTGGDLSFGTVAGTSVGTWDITASFNLDTALAQADDSGDRITDMSVALDNQLLAQTTAESGLTLATIDKKHFDVSGTTTGSTQQVPEPASMSLLIGGSLLMARRRRRPAPH